MRYLITGGFGFLGGNLTVVDIVEARDLLNWTPNVSASQGIALMLDWVQSL